MAVPNECNKRKGILKVFDRETKTFVPALRNPYNEEARLIHNCPCEVIPFQVAIVSALAQAVLEGKVPPQEMPDPDSFRYDYLDEEPPEFKEAVVTGTHLADSLIRKIFEGAKR